MENLSNDGDSGHAPLTVMFSTRYSKQLQAIHKIGSVDMSLHSGIYLLVISTFSANITLTFQLLCLHAPALAVILLTGSYKFTFVNRMFSKSYKTATP